MKVGYIILVSIAAVGLVSSCVKEKNFPAAPVITFKSFENFVHKSPDGTDSLDNNGKRIIDSAHCTIKFTDGDGDIGRAYGEGTDIDDLVLEYLYKDASGNFVPYDAKPSTSAFDTLFFKDHVPDITPLGQYKALEGEIRAKLAPAPIYSPLHTVARFEIKLRDRAGHWSNSVSTPDILIPQ